MKVVYATKQKCWKIAWNSFKSNTQSKGKYLEDKDWFDVCFKTKERAENFLAKLTDYIKRKKSQ